MTRRSALLAGFGSVVAVCGQAFAGGKFWNEKEPSAWSENEIDRILTDSPWANETSAEMNFSAMQQGGGGMGSRGMSGPGGGGRGMGGPGMGGPGMGGPGMGGPGMGGPGMGGEAMGGPPGGGGSPQIKALVRWESAAPVRAALKNAGADQAFYVISVSGLPPVGAGRRPQGREGAPAATPESRQEMEELMKQSTSLVPKGRAGISPSRIDNSGDGKILFYFAKEGLPLSSNDKQVTFTTRLGPLEIKSKFDLKQMKYRGELAL